MSRAVRRDGRNLRAFPLAPRVALVLAFAFASVAALAACGTTVVDDTDPTDVVQATTTTVPLPATTTARIEQIVVLARGLGDLIVDGGDSEAIRRIDALWSASSAEVGDDDPDLGREIEHQLALLHAGVERNRPADADKASRNLAAVLRAYLAAPQRLMLDERAARSALRRQSISIAVAVIPFALAFGVSCAESDLGVGEAMGFSALVFTGAAQFAAVRVLGDGGAPAAAIATAVLLSLRLLAYGVVMAPILDGPRWWRALASHFMLDETMAAGASQPTRRLQREAYLLCGVLIFVLWNVGTVAGVLAGSSAGDLVETLGIDATIPAAFLALLWPRLADRTQRAVALAGAIIALVLVPIAPAGLPILAAGAGVVAARLVRPRPDTIER